MGSLLQRSCEVAMQVGYAPRAVALAKAAANVYDRVGRADELRRCVATLSRAHQAAGQTKEALTAAKRLRELAFLNSGVKIILQRSPRNQ